MSRHISLTRENRTTPWGFDVTGGKDKSNVLTVSDVRTGSLADQYGLTPGAQISMIGDVPTVLMTQAQARSALTFSGTELELDVWISDVLSTKKSADYPTKTFSSTMQPNSPSNQGSALQISPNPPNVLQTPPYKSPDPIAVQQPPAYKSPTYNVQENLAPRPFIPSPSRSGNKSPAASPKAGPRSPASSHMVSSSPKVVPEHSLDVAFPVDRSHASGFQKPTTSGSNPPVFSNKKVGELIIPPSRVFEGITNRIPVCQSCKQNIRGPYVMAEKYNFCPEHFTCNQCNRSLKDQPYYDRDGYMYCEADFQNLIAQRCAKCFQGIVGVNMQALHKSWHPHCFTCTRCGKRLGDKFHIDDSQTLLCEKDWKELHTTGCSACKRAIYEIDRFIDFHGKKYHAECFCCTACRTPLDGKPVHTRNEQPYCPVHAKAASRFA